MNNTKLRVVWIIPNIFCYFMFLWISTFVIINWDGLLEIKELGKWVMLDILLFSISIFGSYRIWRWIKDGRL
ncbi:hypothetical protein EKG37_07150 [Robertmurraya yapensis]|uniref:Uncharacterized protein n=1 Tax=Bacillus yapensis TaxID=2492960 RepID=A0A3S0KMV1_9BACI|nr:hypothetical protein [Bacillus yapensis]RTR33981.1 hypothetical protein EKG37_07150 [Bacillus yapensis]TKS97299.1 hypothetical protein FAR12_07150 [Bacillus yapensis]